MGLVVLDYLEERDDIIERRPPVDPVIFLLTIDQPCSRQFWNMNVIEGYLQILAVTFAHEPIEINRFPSSGFEKSQKQSSTLDVPQQIHVLVQ